MIKFVAPNPNSRSTATNPAAATATTAQLLTQQQQQQHLVSSLIKQPTLKQPTISNSNQITNLSESKQIKLIYTEPTQLEADLNTRLKQPANTNELKVKLLSATKLHSLPPSFKVDTIATKSIVSSSSSVSSYAASASTSSPTVSPTCRLEIASQQQQQQQLKPQVPAKSAIPSFSQRIPSLQNAKPARTLSANSHNINNNNCGSMIVSTPNVALSFTNQIKKSDQYLSVPPSNSSKLNFLIQHFSSTIVQLIFN